MEMNKTAQILLYLLRCALHNTPPKAVSELDYDALYALCGFHSVTAMTAMALESGGLLTEQHTTAESIKKWKDAKIKAIRKNILLDNEREQILQYLDKQGVWYLPLKGCVLKDMYPKMGMRQMADNDILFDKEYQHQLKAYMEDRGYKSIDFAKGNHDVYEKPPVYNFEFHTSLFNPYAALDWSAYYENVKERLVKDPDNACGYHFSDEDFYIYILIHAYKHYSVSGTGIRILLDLYVFLSQRNSRLDWTYINDELRVLEIRDFEETAKTVAMKLFGENEGCALTQEDQIFLCYLMGSGTYGTVDNRVKGELEQIQTGDGEVSIWTKLRYVWKRLFPDRVFMKQYNSFCREHEWSIPFFWIYRLVNAMIYRRKAMRTEFQAMNKVK